MGEPRGVESTETGLGDGALVDSRGDGCVVRDAEGELEGSEHRLSKWVSESRMNPTRRRACSVFS